MAWELPLVAAGDPGSELTAGQDGGVLRRSVLPGGVRVISELLPGMRSAAIGVWVGVGSRDELDGHLGSTHFLEHLLFKGTARRTAQDIANAFDAVGGESNAVTGKETTCYYAKVIDTDLPMAVDLILDMVTSATIHVADVEVERGVILEELAMNEDDPSDVAHEKFLETVFGAHPLGRPVGGTPDHIRAVPRDAIWEHYQQHYRPDTIVISVAGNVDHDAVCEQAMSALSQAGWDVTSPRPPAQRREAQDADAQTVHAAGGELVVSRPTEQDNVLIGCVGLPFNDDRRFAMSMLNAVLGSGMSSRLFQEIRERRGLAYATYSFSSGMTGTGVFGLYAGCSPQRTMDVSELLVEQWQLMADHGPTEEELIRARGQIRGATVLGLEDPAARMMRLGRTEVSQATLLSIDEVLARIDDVQAADVQSLTADLLTRPRSRVIVGATHPV